MSARSTRLPLGRITAALISRTNLRTGSVPPNACPNRHERLWNISVPKLQRAQRFLRPVLVFGAVGALAIVIYASIILAARGGGRTLQHWLGKLFCQIVRATDGGVVKIAQILATRSDLLTPAFLASLSCLHNKAFTRSATESLETLSKKTRAALAKRYRMDEVPSTLAGSAAQIHRAIDRTTGAAIAIKIIRPDTRRVTIRDAVLLRRLALRLGRLTTFHNIPLFAAVAVVCRQVVLQFDLNREGNTQRQIASVLASGGVRIPNVASMSDKSVLAMEWIDGLRPIDEIGSDPERRDVALQCLRLLYRLIFVHGWVHCDFHPGNVLLDPVGQLVLLDFGLVTRIGEVDRRSLAKFFLAIASNDPASGLEVILDRADSVTDQANIAELEHDLEILFDRTSRKTASEFQLADFVRHLFLLQARHGVRSTTAFTVPIVALGVLEGGLKKWHSEIDFQREAIPFVLEALDTGEGATS